MLKRRKTNRLEYYDYSHDGAYFITICTKNRTNILWDTSDAISGFNSCYMLSKYGQIVNDAILKIHEHYDSVIVDKYVIMPNHIHLILIIQNQNRRAMHAPTLSTVIQQMKGYVSKNVGFSLWQKSFYDHIIRSERSYQEIWQYIDENPLKWKYDCYYS